MQYTDTNKRTQTQHSKRAFVTDEDLTVSCVRWANFLYNVGRVTPCDPMHSLITSGGLAPLPAAVPERGKHRGGQLVHGGPAVPLAATGTHGNEPAVSSVGDLVGVRGELPSVEARSACSAWLMTAALIGLNLAYFDCTFWKRLPKLDDMVLPGCRAIVLVAHPNAPSHKTILATAADKGSSLLGAAM
uniref:Uncharacterized protein n=1 Tax=Anopheles coluzzii TaxID=1518534 RepID=A0A8W7P115_ANOCL